MMRSKKYVMDKRNQRPSLDSCQQSSLFFFLSCFQKPPLQRHCEDEKDVVQPARLEDWTPVLRGNHVPATTNKQKAPDWLRGSEEGM